MGLDEYLASFNSLIRVLPQHRTKQSEFKEIINQFTPQTSQIIDRIGAAGLYYYNLTDWAKSLESKVTSWDDVFREESNGRVPDLIGSGLSEETIKRDLASYHGYLKFKCDELSLENFGRVFRSISSCGGNISTEIAFEVTELLKGLLSQTNDRSASGLYQRIPVVNFSGSKEVAFQRFTKCKESRKQTVHIPGFPKKVVSNSIARNFLITLNSHQISI